MNIIDVVPEWLEAALAEGRAPTSDEMRSEALLRLPNAQSRDEMALLRTLEELQWEWYGWRGVI